MVSLGRARRPQRSSCSLATRRTQQEGCTKTFTHKEWLPDDRKPRPVEKGNVFQIVRTGAGNLTGTSEVVDTSVVFREVLNSL